MKLKRTILATAAISALMTSTAFAGTWKTGAGANQNKWWYENDNGSYLSGCWQWIDGNGDGIAECYYFNQDGWMLANTKTPDGYQVNANGAWTINGTVQVKQVGAAPISESDFVVAGDNSVTQNNADHSIISNWARLGYYSTPYHVFVIGDSLATARGISLGAPKSDVVTQYGNTADQNFNAGADKCYQMMVASGNAEANIIGQAATVLDYSANSYGIRFYFNNQNLLLGVVYYRDDAVVNQGNTGAAENYVGNYTYSGGASYLLNSQTGQYELFAQTANASEDEWFNKIYPADAIRYDGFCIEDVSENIIEFNIMEEKYQLLRYGNAWVYDDDLDGVLQESEKDNYSGLELLGDGRVSLSMVNEYDYQGEQEAPYGWPDKGTVMITAFYTKN